MQEAHWGNFKNCSRECDIYIEKEKDDFKSGGVFLEVKFIQMIKNLAKDKKHSAKRDLEKLKEAGAKKDINGDQLNFPQGLLIIGFLNNIITIKDFSIFASDYGLDIWSNKHNGISTFPLKNKCNEYDECLVGFWLRDNDQEGIVNL